MLRVEGLTVQIGELTILRALSFAVPAGATVGLVGRNGAGKTTTLRAIMGLVAASAGRVRLGDQDLLRQPAYTRNGAGIGYMPEDRRLIGPLSVRDNMLLVARTGDRGQHQARFEAIAALLPEVVPLLRRRAASLSGGQQKLVALARALFAARSLLLLDEPMEGVSPALSARMAEVVRRFQEREPQLAVLVAESDLNRIRLLASQLYTIERGEVLADAPGPATLRDAGRAAP